MKYTGSDWYGALVVKIGKVLPHPDPESTALELTRVLSVEDDPNSGIPVVIKKGSFQEGDLALYSGMDAILPTTNPRWAFLDAKGKPHRLRARRLRGTFSEGLLVPLEVDEVDLLEGTDLTVKLGITKWLADGEQEPAEYSFELPTTTATLANGLFRLVSNPENGPAWCWMTPERVRNAIKAGFVTLNGEVVNKPDETIGPGKLEARIVYGDVRGKRSSGSVPSGNSESCPFANLVPKYDLDALRKWGSNVFVEGEVVVCREKIHGCVIAKTDITMVDGSKRAISEIRPGDEILGVDAGGKLVPAKVVNIFNNGKAERWLKVRGSRIGRGGSQFVVTCTEEHRFWNPDRGVYIEASALRSGDAVSVFRSDPTLSPLQESVLLGKLLGDGSIAIAGKTAAVHFGHAERYRDYLEWTATALGSFDSGAREASTSGYGTAMVRTRSIGSAFILEKFADFRGADGVKLVPAWVAKRLDPIAIAFWYMDDGSLVCSEGQEDRATFAVCAFSEADCEFLLKGLLKFQIRGVYYKAEGYSRIRLNAESAERLFLLIAPYIPPVMQYKLPERYRGGPGWLPRVGTEYKPHIGRQTIISVEEATNITSSRMDLETSTHNYFANDVLVHNCNARFLHDGERLWVGTRTRWVKKPEAGSRCTWWVAAEAVGLEAKLATKPGLVLFGEVFGQVQDLKYGAGEFEVRLAFFDAMELKSRAYLSEYPLRQVVAELGLEMAPLAYEGPWDSAKVLELRNGPSLVPGANHTREGVVVRSIEERIHPRLGRVVLKVVGEDYKTRK